MLGSRYSWASRQQQPKIQTARPMLGDTGRQPRGHPDPFPAVATRAAVSLVHGDDRRKNVYEALMAIDEQIKPRLKREGAMLAALKRVLKNKNVATPVPSITDMEQLDENMRAMTDKYNVEISANPESDFSSTLRAFLSIIEKSIQGRFTLPDALAWFPTENLVRDSIRSVPESVLGLRLLKSGYVAQYRSGKGFLVREAFPDAAAQVFAKLKERFGQTTPVRIADEAFTATD